MTLRNLLPTLLFASLTALGLVAGCGKKTDKTNGVQKTQETGVPADVALTEAEKRQLREEVATYDKALDRIRQCRDTIRKETTDGVPAKAHRSLDEVALVLEWLPEIARNSDVPKQQWETVVSHAQKLRELFEKVHGKIDKGEAPNYEAVSAEIETSLKSLESVEAGKPSAKPKGATS